MASFVSGVSGSVIAAILYDAAKGIGQQFNDPFSRALEDTSVYFSKKRDIEFKIDRLRDILEGNDSDIEKLKSEVGFVGGDEFALQFAIFGDLHFEDQSENLPIAKEIVDYFIERFEYHVLSNPEKASLLLREYIMKYGHQIMERLGEAESKTQAVLDKVDSVSNSNQDILRANQGISNKIQNLDERLTENMSANTQNLRIALLAPEYDTQIDYARDLIKACKPKEALNYLEKMKTRVWPSSEPMAKYRILTNMANAKLMLRIDIEAANLFIEALKHNPDDDKALCNAALGHFLLDQLEESKIYVDKALDENRVNATAHSINIHLALNDKPIEEVIETIPSGLINTREVASTLSEIFIQNNDLHNAKKWLQIAVDNDDDDLPELKGLLGAITINLVLKDQAVVYINQLNEEQRGQIKDAVDILDAAWDRVSNTDLRVLLVDIIANRAFAKRIVGDMDGALKDIETALDIEPTKPTFIKNRALMALHTAGKAETSKAIELLKEIAGNEETLEATIILAELLRREHRFEESMEFAEEILDGNYPESMKEEANRLCVQLYIDTNDLQKAKEEADILLAGDPDNILHIIVASNVANALGEKEGAISLLDEARSYISVSTTARELLELADAFYAMEQFESAASVWERTLDKNANTPYTHKMLYAYYHSGQINKALEICTDLRQKYGPIRNVSELESVIYEGIRDFPKVKEICQQYLDTYLDDFGMKLRLAVANYHLEDFIELDEFLDREIDLDVLSLENGIQLAKLFAARRQTRRALDAIYEIRRKYINEADAHLSYVSIFLHRERDADEWLNVSRVEVNTAICIESDTKQQNWYILEDRREVNIDRKERNSTHPLYQEVMGKAIGNKVTEVKNPYDSRIGEIIDIRSKYVYAFQDTLTNFERDFPGIEGFYSMKFDKDKVFRLLDSSHDTQQQAETLYKGQGMPLGLFSKLIGKDILDVWSVRTVRSDLGIKCCIGSTEERNKALSILADRPKLIVDIPSLMTLFSIDARDIVIHVFGKLGIAQSTIDTINEIIELKSVFQSDGTMSLAKHGNEYVRQEFSPEQVGNYINYLNNILGWIKENCEIMPVGAKLNIRLDEIKMLDESIGASSIDTVLIAGEEGNILYSDDLYLRSIAKNDFGIDGTWTQAILMDCLNAEALSKEEYCGMVVRLVELNYSHISVDADVIIGSAKQADWHREQPYLNVIKALNGSNSDELSALSVATQFLYNLILLDILPPGYVGLIHALLDELTIGRNKVDIANKLKAISRPLFRLLPKQQELIENIIDTWIQMQ